MIKQAGLATATTLTGDGVDVAIVSLGATLGLRYADDALAGLIEEAGATCALVPVDAGRLRRLRRGMLLTDLTEALAARRAGSAVRAGALVYSTVTAALLQPHRAPFAVWFDSPASANRPGWGGAWQRRREAAVFAAARLLLPWSPAAGAAAGLAAPVVLSPPVDRVDGHAARDIAAVAYSGNPEKRGLTLLCRAWQAVATESDGPLVIGGIDATDARRFLQRRGVADPEQVVWAGVLARTAWLDLVARARIFVSASRQEEWGLAQLEALAAGTPLVTVPTGGFDAALPIARSLEPGLHASSRDVGPLAAAIRAGLDLDDSARATYREGAAAALAPYDGTAARAVVANELLPRLLG